MSMTVCGSLPNEKIDPPHNSPVPTPSTTSLIAINTAAQQNAPTKSCPTGRASSSRARAHKPDLASDAAFARNANVETSPASSRVPTSSLPRARRTSAGYNRTSVLPIS
jgi:hypothetical protein